MTGPRCSLVDDLLGLLLLGPVTTLDLPREHGALHHDVDVLRKAFRKSGSDWQIQAKWVRKPTRYGLVRVQCFTLLRPRQCRRGEFDE